MPLYIRDDDVDALAVELQRKTGASTKTEAVRNALRHELDRITEETPLRHRLAALRERARVLGLPNPNFDMKRFSDSLWEGQ
jgi:antitoxin VapB